MSAETLRAKIREIPDFPKPGILFYDITTLLKDPAAYKEAIDLMLEPVPRRADRPRGRDGVARVHLLAPMAYQLDTGLVPVRKLGKLPAETLTVEYALEYGSNTLEIHRDADPAGPEGPHRRRPARDRRHGPRHDRADRAAQGRGRRAWRSSSSSTSSRAATGSRAAASRASSSTDAGSARRRTPIRRTSPMTDDPSSQPDPGPAPLLPPVRGRRRDVGGHRSSGAAQLLQQQSADAARELLGGDPEDDRRAAGAHRARGARRREMPRPPGYRAPLRWDGDVCGSSTSGACPSPRRPSRSAGRPRRSTAINDGAHRRRRRSRRSSRR